MSRRLVPVWMCLSVMCAATVWAGPAQRVPVQQSVYEVPETPRWYVGAEGMCENRDLFTYQNDMELSAWHVDGVLGVQPWSWLILQAGVGATEAARIDDVTTDSGPEWLLRIRANLAEYVFTTKPGVGRHQVLRLGVTATYRDSDANYDDSNEERYFKWQEYLFEPYLQYTVNRLGDGNYDPLDVTAAALRVGPAFSWINGRYNFVDLDEKRTYGVSVGGDVLLACGLTLGVDAQGYASGDGSVGASLGHRF